MNVELRVGREVNFWAKCQTPRYYDKQLKKRNPQQLDLLKQQREAEGLKKAHDNTPERRAVKEQVAQARLNQLKRGL